jgi:hypothetical protein
MKVISSPLDVLNAQPAEVFAYIFKYKGPEYLKQQLKEFATVRSSYVSYEFLSEIANKLRSVDMVSAAEVVESVAADAPHMWLLPTQIPPDCPSLIAERKAELATKRKRWESTGQLQTWRPGRS